MAAASGPGSPSWAGLEVQTWAALGAALVAAAYLLKQLMGSKGSSSDGAKSPPGPSWFIPYVGEMVEFSRSPSAYMWRRYKKYNSAMFKAHIMGFPSVVVGDPDLLRGALNNPALIDAEMPVPTFTKLMGQLYATSGEPHKAFRKHMIQAVGPQNLARITPNLAATIAKHVRTWVDEARAAPNAPVRIDHAVRLMTLDLGLHPIAGLPTPPSEMGELLELAAKVQAGIFAAPLYFPGTQWYTAWHTKPAYVAKLSALLTARFPPAVPGGPLRLEADTGGYPGADTAAATLREFAEVGQELEVGAVTTRTATNLLGATETTASSMIAMLVITGAAPDVVQRIRDEQAHVLRTHGPDITWAQLSTAMPYTDGVVRETVRLFPAAHGIFRRVKTDTQLGPYTLKAGQILTIGLDLLRDIDCERAALKAGAAPGSAETGDEANPPACTISDAWRTAFQPERWMTGGAAGGSLQAAAGDDGGSSAVAGAATSEGNKPTLRVFSFGAHACAGKDLAIAEMKMLLATLARQASWEMVGCGDRDPHITYVPWVRLDNGQPLLKLKLAPLEV